jgi:hypothetical protein
LLPDAHICHKSNFVHIQYFYIAGIRYEAQEHRKCFVVFPLQQWLSERTIFLLFTHPTSRVFSRCSYSILQVVQGHRSQQSVNLVSHKGPLEKFEGVSSGDRFGQELDDHQPKDHSATAYSKILSPSCGSVMALRHILKQRLMFVFEQL